MSEYMIFWDDGQISSVGADGFQVNDGLVYFYEVNESGVNCSIGVFILDKISGFCKTDNLVEINGEDE